MLFRSLVQEIREWFDGPLALSGSIANGRAILAARAMGADFAYMGSAFIATDEARAADGYKQMIVDSSSADVVPVRAPVLVLNDRPVGGVGLMLHEVAASPTLVMESTVVA